MQIDYTGQYAAKEIDQTVSLTSHSARKSFIELWTFNYFSTQIVSLRLANAISNGAKPCCDTNFMTSWLPFGATCSEVGIDVSFSSSSWWYRSCNSYKVSLTICYRNHMSRNRLQTSTHNWTVPSASDVADWMYYKRIHVFLRAGSSNSPQIWGHSCTIVNAVSWCTGQIFICAPLSSNSQPTWACRWFHWKPGLHVQSACHESCVTTWFGTICYL